MDASHLKSLMDQAIESNSNRKKEPEMKGVSWLESEQQRDDSFFNRSGAGMVSNLIANSLPPVHGSTADKAMYLAGGPVIGLGKHVASKLTNGARGAISKHLSKWLKSADIDPELRAKLIRINEDIELNDRPGEIVKDAAGNVLFSSNNNAAHVIRQAIASDKFARQYADILKLDNPKALTDNVTIGLLHDAGKANTPRHILNRARNFPPEGKTYADMQNISYGQDNLGNLMNDVIKLNPDPNTEFWGGLSNANDLPIMKKHADVTKEIVNKYNVPKDLTEKANMHHLHMDGNPYASYPKEFADIKGKKIPIEARIQSIFDATDAASSPRYGIPAPESYEKLLHNNLEKYRGKSTLGTQFDNNLFKLARDSGHIKNYYDNIANKEGYSLAKLINKHRKDTYGKDILDELPPEAINTLYQMAFGNAVNRKD
jgi:HD-GYP domain-containing protein (c-di-GMP phosphodiesterase class II)